MAKKTIQDKVISLDVVRNIDYPLPKDFIILHNLLNTHLFGIKIYTHEALKRGYIGNFDIKYYEKKDTKQKN